MLLPLVTATFCSKLWTIINIMCVHFTQINKQDICTRVIKKRFFFSLFSLGVGGVDGVEMRVIAYYAEVGHSM